MIRTALRLLARGAAGAGRLGCRGTTPSAATTTSVSFSTTAARSTSTKAGRAWRDRDDGPQPARDRADRVLQRAEGLRRAAAASRADAALREKFFSRLKMLWYAGAGLPQPVWDEIDELAIETLRRAHHVAHRPRRDRDRAVRAARNWEARSPATSACRRRASKSSWCRAGQGRSALPRTQRHARLLAPARAHAAAFDEEGFYRLGDAVQASSIPAIPAKGLLFDGRIAEDFKLSTGTWVSVGPLRAHIIAHFAPFVQDVVDSRARSRRHRRAAVSATSTPVAGSRPVSPSMLRPAKFSAIPRAARVRIPAEHNARAQHRQLEPRLPRDPARGAFDRRRRDDRQGLDQPGRVLRHRASLVDELHACPPSARVIAIDEEPWGKT